MINLEKVKENKVIKIIFIFRKLSIFSGNRINISTISENNSLKSCTNFEDLTFKIKNLTKSSDLETLSIPNVQWDDIGGLTHAKNEIIDTIMLPQLSPQFFDDFLHFL